MNKAEFKEQLKQTGIVPGDLVMVHSSYKSLGGVEGGADTVVDAFTELVGDNGAVFFPTYTVDSWCKYHYFDYNETPSEMGIITEIARLRENAKRTRHPIHNFAILGRGVDMGFFVSHNESYDAHSPFAYFHHRRGLVISIGVYWDDTITHVHYAEQLAGAPFRRVKSFSGIYIDPWGIPRLDYYRMSVRKTLRHITHVAPAYENYLVPQGVVKNCTVGKATVSYFRADDYVKAVVPLVQEHPEWFYYLKGASNG